MSPFSTGTHEQNLTVVVYSIRSLHLPLKLRIYIFITLSSLVKYYTRPAQLQTFHQVQYASKNGRTTIPVRRTTLEVLWVRTASYILHHLGICHPSQLHDDDHPLVFQDPITTGMDSSVNQTCQWHFSNPLRSIPLGQKYYRKPYSELQA